MSVKKNKEEEQGGIINITDKDNKEIYLYSILPEKFISEQGLLNLAVVGRFKDNQRDEKGNLVVDSFEANPDFIHLFHEFLDGMGRYSSALITQATRQAEGSWVYVIDQRVEDVNAKIAPEDIIGGFKVEKGKLGEYAGNPGHILLSNKGIFKIGMQLKQELINLIMSKYRPN